MRTDLRARVIFPWLLLGSFALAASLVLAAEAARFAALAALLLLLGLLAALHARQLAARLSRLEAALAARQAGDELHPSTTRSLAEQEVLRLNQELERQVEQRTAQLRASEQRFRTLIHHFPDSAVFLIDPDGRYLIADGELVTRNGFTREQLEGKLPRESGMPREILDATAVSFGQVLAGGTVDVEFRFAGQSLHTQMVPIRDAHGAVTAVLSVTRDVSALRRAEEERMALQRQLLEAQRLESIGMLAGGIAHDFNNLITTILGHAELLQLELPPESPLTASLQAICAGSRRAAELTAQMLAYAGKGRLQAGPTDLNRLVRELDGLLRLSLPPQSSLSYQLAQTLPPVEADPAQLRQLVTNLLLNAAEAISAGGTITVSTSLAQLDAASLAGLSDDKAARPGRYARLSVSDNGQGMDEATQARMFEPFFSTKFTGRGLGLAAVQGIVRSHAGVLQVRSAPGHGTQFDVWLPSTTASEPAVDTPAALGTATGVVLVIDDEQAVREVIARMLGRLGLSAHLAEHGPAGLAALDHGIDGLLCVLVDLTMPGMRGDAVARTIAARYPGTRIVLMSGFSAHEIARSDSDLPVAGVLQKPFSLTTLRRLLDL